MSQALEALERGNLAAGTPRQNKVWTRFLRVAALDFSFQVRRPLVIILVLAVVLTTWGLTTGNLSISTGDQSVGGKRAYITSEHALALTLCVLTLLYYAFFISVAAGTSISRDEEMEVLPLLHTTGLRAREYVWGKFAGVLGCFMVILLLQIVTTVLIYHLLPYADADKIRGPFAWLHYAKPALLFALPQVVFVTGVTLWLGERTRRPILVFLFPVALLMVVAFFLWDWSPTWLDPRWNRVLFWLDPSGYRWLNETQLKVDRGADYYNTAPVAYDAQFLWSRVACTLAGLAAVAWSSRRFGATLRGAHPTSRRGRRGAVATAAVASTVEAAAESAPLAALAMRVVPVSFVRQAWTIAWFELRNLASSAGLYLFTPLILLQALETAYYTKSIWTTRLIVTPGGFTVLTMNTLTLCIVLLLLFYTVESFDRERATKLQPIYSSTPVRTGAFLLGKALANCFVAAVILFAAWLGCAVMLVAQQKVGMDLRPFLVVWGLVMAPTFLLWSSFVMMLMAATGNRYASYGLAAAALIATGWLQVRGKMNWVLNWDVWSAIRWSDLGFLEPNGLPLLLNRLLALGLAAFFLAITVRLLGRREFDATRVVHRLAPVELWRRTVPVLLWGIVPAALSIWLGLLVWHGFQSKPAKRHDRDYWKQNLATWKDVPQPSLAAVDLALSFEPRRSSFRSAGSYLLRNAEPAPFRQFALTLATHIDSVQWTLAGADYKPEKRSNLFVFTPPTPLAPGDTLRLGFAYSSRWPAGSTRDGGGIEEFIQPSGVVLTSFRPILAPMLGFQEEIGVEAKENRYEPRQYPDDWYKSVVPVAYGLTRPFTTRIRIEGPEEYTYNSVGTMVEERVEGGRRHVLWVSDFPVSIFNVVAGKWEVRRGAGTAIYYHPGHRYNIDEMGRGLDAARRYYSEWFHPFPWQELKLSEFANLANYAQGFATNITFSEGIGFLTISDPRNQMAFTVTAHEAAHQWWGNLVTPGKGPGGDLLSEGMSHFATLLLQQQVHGLQGRIEFAKRIEERYNDERRVDAERPLVKIDGSKEGDRTVTYDKGGWVFWMLHDLMGREANLAGLQAFIQNHKDNPDHPLLEDFVDEMRPFAPDPAAFDAFTRQWFFEVVVPEYHFEAVQREKQGERWVVTGTLRNGGSGRMPVQVAAARGERFEKQSAAQALEGPATQAPDYAESRTPLELGAGEAAPFRLECGFEPDRILADPDAQVLQLRRKYAVVRF
ncbi:MAG TPA: M1 family aminopeptidase [Candidatus Krumholzibacteria bacterium]|nr:M1 family aminopeptidase [Candidatus Krumholzibacteria bacterium]